MGYSFKKEIKVLQPTILFKKCTKSNLKPNKIWVHKGCKVYNRSVKSWPEKITIEMYSAHNERNSAVAERFIGTLSNKIYKYWLQYQENMYADKLDDIVNKYNNTYHSTIKRKLVDVKPSIYIAIKLENNMP